jgi:mRNA interferase MazF
VSPELINRFGTPIVLPITRTPRGYATHVELDGVLDAVSYIQCELIRAVASDRLLRYVAAAPPDTLARVDSILRRILVL